MKMHDLISHDTEDLIRLSSPVVGLGYGIIRKKALRLKKMGKWKAMKAVFLPQILGERVFGSVVADYVGDYVIINYFVKLASTQWFWSGRAIMPRAERELLVAGYQKLNSLVRSGNQNVLAFYDHLDYAIGPLLTFCNCLIHEQQDKKWYLHIMMEF